MDLVLVGWENPGQPATAGFRTEKYYVHQNSPV
jgi:hypothetical protein